MKKNVITYSLIVTVSVALYFKCLFYGITNSDDEVLIAANLPFLQDIANLLTVFTTDAFYQVKSIDLYRPLQSATYILDAQWGLNPAFTTHLTNLILHILSCLAIFHLLTMLRFRERVAAFGALVYAVHYLFAAAVAWIPARGDLLLAIFTFLSLITFIKILETGRWRSYLLHLLCFTCALFAKETAVVIPILLLCYLWTHDRFGALDRRSFMLPLYYAAASSVYFILKSSAVAPTTDEVGLVPFLKNIRTIPETVAKFFLPVNISTLPQYETSATLSGLVLMTVLLAVHLYYRNRLNRQMLFPVAWFLLFIIPGMTYFPNFYNFCYEHVDHRAYLVCFGLLLMVLNLVQAFRLDTKRYFPVSAVVLLAWLGALNLHFSGNYRDATEFSARAISTNPNSALAFSIYGNEMLLQGREDEALSSLNRSIRICNKFMPALHTRAKILRMRGLDREALADLDTLLAADPDYDADDYHLRALIRIDGKDYAGAKKDFASALRLNPNHAAAARGLRELQRTVRGNELLPHVREAMQYNREGVEAGRRGDFRAAEILFRKALAADPGFFEVNLNLGNALHEQGDLAAACSAWQIAAEHGNDSAGALLKEYCHR